MQRVLWILAAIVAIVIGVLLYVNRGNNSTIVVQYPDGSVETVKVSDRSCQMVGWQNKVGLSFSFDVLKKYQGTGGFNFDASQVRQLDDLQTDFGLQFEALCKERITGAYKGREALYDCRRSNVGNALSALRELKLTLEPVKSIQDAAAQKDAVSTALTKYYAISANNFSKDCNPRALNVDREELRFNGKVNLQDANISNGGYFDMSWQLANTPHNFLCDADSYKLVPAGHATLHVYRLFGDVDAAHQTLTIHDNFNETADLKIVVEDGTASREKLINDIQNELNSAPSHDLTTAAIATVRKNYPSASEGLVNWITGELLDKMGNPGAAKIVLQKAEQDPKLKEQPQFKLDLGTVLVKTGDRDQSKLLLDDLSKHADKFYAVQAITTMHESNIPTNKFGSESVFNPGKQNSVYPHHLTGPDHATEQMKNNPNFEKVTPSFPK